MDAAQTRALYRQLADWCLAEQGAAYNQEEWDRGADQFEAQLDQLDIDYEDRCMMRAAFARAQAGRAPDCGTACCVAGAAVHVASRRSVLAALRRNADFLSREDWVYPTVVQAVAIDLLRLTPAAAELLFVATANECTMPDTLLYLADVRGTRNAYNVEQAMAYAASEWAARHPVPA